MVSKNMNFFKKAFFATIAVLLVVGVSLGAKKVSGYPESQLRDGPWVLEYGFAGSVSEWDFAVDLLTDEGVPEEDIHIPEPPPIGINFTRALVLAEYLNDNDLEDVKIIAHSQGGWDAAYLVEIGYLLDDNQSLPDWLEIPQGGVLAAQKAEFIEAYQRVESIYTLHTPFLGSTILFPTVADLVDEFVNYGSARWWNQCCKDPYTHVLCPVLINPDDGLVRYTNMFLYSNNDIVHKYWIGTRKICHSEARLVPDYFLDIIYE